MNIQVHLPKHLSANVKNPKYHKVYGMTQKVDVMGVRSEAFFALQQKTQVLARLFNFLKKKIYNKFPIFRHPDLVYRGIFCCCFIVCCQFRFFRVFLLCSLCPVSQAAE